VVVNAQATGKRNMNVVGGEAPRGDDGKTSVSPNRCDGRGTDGSRLSSAAASSDSPAAAGDATSNFGVHPLHPRILQKLISVFCMEISMISREYALTIIPKFHRAVVRFIKHISQEQVRDLTKVGVGEMEEHIEMALMVIYSEALADNYRLEFGLGTGLKRLLSKSIERRINGLEHISDCLHSLVNKSHWFSVEVCLWVQQNEIMRECFGTRRSHPELIRGCKRLLHFLVERRALGGATMDLLWKVTVRVGLNEVEGQDQLLEVWKEIKWRFEDLEIRDLVKRFQTLPSENFTPWLMHLLSVLIDGYSLSHKTVEMGVLLLWKLSQDGSGVPPGGQHVAMRLMRDALRANTITIANLQQRILELCVNNIKTHTSVHVALNMVRHIIERYPETSPPGSREQSRGSVIQWFEERHQLIQLILYDLTHFRSTTIQSLCRLKPQRVLPEGESKNPGVAADGKNSLKAAAVAVGETKDHSSLELLDTTGIDEEWYLGQVSVRLSFLQFLLCNSRLALPRQRLVILWDLLHNRAIVLKERELLFTWFTRALRRGGEGSGGCMFDTETAKFVFTEILIKSLDAATLSDLGYQCFERYFIRINLYEGNLLDLRFQRRVSAAFNRSMRTPLVYYPLQRGLQWTSAKMPPLGLDLLWRIASEAPEERPRMLNSAIRLLTSVYHRLDKDLLKGVEAIRIQYISHCLRNLFDATNPSRSYRSRSHPHRRQDNRPATQQQSSLGSRVDVRLALRCIKLLNCLLNTSEAHGIDLDCHPTSQPHGARVISKLVDITVWWIYDRRLQGKRTRLRLSRVHTHSTLWQVRRAVASHAEIDPRLIELRHRSRILPALLNSATLGSLGLVETGDMSGLTAGTGPMRGGSYIFHATKLRIAEEHRAPLLDDRQRMTPGLQRAIENVFRRFATGSAARGMGAKVMGFADLKRYMTRCGVDASACDDEVQEMLRSNGDGSVVNLRGFMQFYMDACLGRPDDVWEDLTVHGYRHDLTHISEPEGDGFDVDAVESAITNSTGSNEGENADAVASANSDGNGKSTGSVNATNITAVSGGSSSSGGGNKEGDGATDVEGTRTSHHRRHPRPHTSIELLPRTLLSRSSTWFHQLFQILTAPEPSPRVAGAVWSLLQRLPTHPPIVEEFATLRNVNSPTPDWDPLLPVRGGDGCYGLLYRLQVVEYLMAPSAALSTGCPIQIEVVGASSTKQKQSPQSQYSSSYARRKQTSRLKKMKRSNGNGGESGGGGGDEKIGELTAASRKGDTATETEDCDRNVSTLRNISLKSTNPDSNENITIREDLLGLRISYSNDRNGGKDEDVRKNVPVRRSGCDGDSERKDAVPHREEANDPISGAIRWRRRFFLKGGYAHLYKVFLEVSGSGKAAEPPSTSQVSHHSYSKEEKLKADAKATEANEWQQQQKQHEKEGEEEEIKQQQVVVEKDKQNVDPKSAVMPLPSESSPSPPPVSFHDGDPAFVALYHLLLKILLSLTLDAAQSSGELGVDTLEMLSESLASFAPAPPEKFGANGGGNSVEKGGVEQQHRQQRQSELKGSLRLHGEGKYQEQKHHRVPRLQEQQPDRQTQLRQKHADGSPITPLARSDAIRTLPPILTRQLSDTFARKTLREIDWGRVQSLVFKRILNGIRACMEAGERKSSKGALVCSMRDMEPLVEAGLTLWCTCFLIDPVGFLCAAFEMMDQDANSVMRCLLNNPTSPRIRRSTAGAFLAVCRLSFRSPRVRTRIDAAVRAGKLKMFPHSFFVRWLCDRIFENAEKVNGGGGKNNFEEQFLLLSHILKISPDTLETPRSAQSGTGQSLFCNFTDQKQSQGSASSGNAENANPNVMWEVEPALRKTEALAKPRKSPAASKAENVARRGVWGSHTDQSLFPFVSKLIEALKHHRSVESPHSDRIDFRLSGMLKVLTDLFRQPQNRPIKRVCSELSRSSGEEELKHTRERSLGEQEVRGSPELHRSTFIEDLFTYFLFGPGLRGDGPSWVAKRLHELDTVKCNTSRSRQACFGLLAELAHGSPSNLSEIVWILSTQMEGVKALDGWGNDISTHLVSKADGERFVGLKNMGATCYMNSILQQLYMTTRLRYGILTAADHEGGEKEDDETDKDEEGGEDEEKKKQSGEEVIVNSSVSSVPKREDKQKENKERNAAKVLLQQLQVMFGFLAASERQVFDTKSFFSSYLDENGNAVNPHRQFDAQEFLSHLLNLVDKALSRSSRRNLIKASLMGTFCDHQISSRDGKITMERFEPFLTISLDVQGLGTLTDSLNSFVSGETLPGMKKAMCLGRLPNTLMLHLKRFAVNIKTFTYEKLYHRFEFPEHIDLYPYTREGLGRMGVNAQAATSPVSKSPLPPHSQQTEDEDSWAGDRHSNPKRAPFLKLGRSRYLYHLVGVVVHKGSTEQGHYYSIIRRGRGGSNATTGNVESGSEEWLKFDDSKTTPFDPSRLAAECFGEGLPAAPAASAGGAGGGVTRSAASGGVMGNSTPHHNRMHSSHRHRQHQQYQNPPTLHEFNGGQSHHHNRRRRRYPSHRGTSSSASAMDMGIDMSMGTDVAMGVGVDMGEGLDGDIDGNLDEAMDMVIDPGYGERKPSGGDYGAQHPHRSQHQQHNQPQHQQQHSGVAATSSGSGGFYSDWPNSFENDENSRRPTAYILVYERDEPLDDQELADQVNAMEHDIKAAEAEAKASIIEGKGDQNNNRKADGSKGKDEKQISSNGTAPITLAALSRQQSLSNPSVSPCGISSTAFRKPTAALVPKSVLRQVEADNHVLRAATRVYSPDLYGFVEEVLGQVARAVARTRRGAKSPTPNGVTRAAYERFVSASFRFMLDVVARSKRKEAFVPMANHLVGLLKHDPVLCTRLLEEALVAHPKRVCALALVCREREVQRHFLEIVTVATIVSATRGTGEKQRLQEEAKRALAGEVTNSSISTLPPCARMLHVMVSLVRHVRANWQRMREFFEAVLAIANGVPGAPVLMLTSPYAETKLLPDLIALCTYEYPKIAGRTPESQAQQRLVNLLPLVAVLVRSCTTPADDYPLSNPRLGDERALHERRVPYRKAGLRLELLASQELITCLRYDRHSVSEILRHWMWENVTFLILNRLIDAIDRARPKQVGAVFEVVRAVLSIEDRKTLQRARTFLGTDEEPALGGILTIMNKNSANKVYLGTVCRHLITVGNAVPALGKFMVESRGFAAPMMQWLRYALENQELLARFEDLANSHGVDLVKVAEGATVWNCPTCTFENLPSDSICSMCAQPRFSEGQLVEAWCETQRRWRDAKIVARNTFSSSYDIQWADIGVETDGRGGVGHSYAGIEAVRYRNLRERSASNQAISESKGHLSGGVGVSVDGLEQVQGRDEKGRCDPGLHDIDLTSSAFGDRPLQDISSAATVAPTLDLGATASTARIQHEVPSPRIMIGADSGFPAGQSGSRCDDLCVPQPVRAANEGASGKRFENGFVPGSSLLGAEKKNPSKRERRGASPQQHRNPLGKGSDEYGSAASSTLNPSEGGDKRPMMVEIDNSKSLVRNDDGNHRESSANGDGEIKWEEGEKVEFWLEDKRQWVDATIVICNMKENVLFSFENNESKPRWLKKGGKCVRARRGNRGSDDPSHYDEHRVDNEMTNMTDNDNSNRKPFSELPGTDVALPAGAPVTANPIWGGGGPQGTPGPHSSSSSALAEPISYYKAQLGQLSQMGFTDERKNLAALQAVNGNIEAALNSLLNISMDNLD